MSATSSKLPVLISGAGPSGLILALIFAKNGIPVRIIEKDSKFHIGQRGAGIQPRTLEIYNYLGVVEDILKDALPNKLRCIYEMPGGTKPAKIHDMTPYSPPTPSVPFRNPVILGQSHTEEILRTHLATYNIHVELNTELVDFEHSADSVVAHIVKHESEQDIQETLTVDWLVGAEGAKSNLRKKLGLTFLGVTRPADRIIAADIVVKNLDTQYWHSWGDLSTRVVFLRPTEYKDVFSVMAAGKEADLDAALEGRDGLAKFIKDVTNRSDLEIGDLKWISDFRPNIRMVNKFGEGRVFVVGDTAHVHSPTGGQGMNSGAQDVFNLGWKLSLVIKGFAPTSLLDTYTTERLPVIREMLDRTTDILEKTLKFRADGSDNSGFDRPQILHQLGVNCRWSPIVVDEQPEAKDAANAGAYLPENPEVLYAGDRAPDAPSLQIVSDGGERTTSFFKLLEPTHHTALLFADKANTADFAPVLHALSACPAGTFRTVVVLPQDMDSVAAQQISGADFSVVDAEGHAFRAYPPATKGYPVIIVRPDGVVGAVVSGVDGVKRYLTNIFKL